MSEKIEEPFKILDYRGISVPLYFDDYGQQIYAVINGKEYGFGSYNDNYLNDVYYIVDQALDYIGDLGDLGFPEAHLEYFFNGRWRDIRLVLYGGRTVKVYILDNKNFWHPENENISDDLLNNIKTDAAAFLSRHLDLIKNLKK